ncbi:MAG: bifunctional UDP-N-acetylglucosamine diphosphorylase/glucosamine-1-phosphate N-acetyltransferase GlmU [Anaerolineae bacterium]|nr:bifunctional UDP-N-acetylglucosamine diphosphorylase/glucosamine-1-phosphate N-acetyltransferase GlmU [Anaerolineae bacterium]MDW8068404.1 bifunctional UDP-N-acetylglucosamine diphosphorylase/glucosamine-1-phosphate N-acetyltransferase GlmU [Anaerolineae bacterium]
MLGVVILAAGQGTRMRSEVPKVLHPLCGRPMVFYTLDAVHSLSDLPPVLVVGYGAEEVRRAVGESVTYVEQPEQRGTGHAVLQARPVLEGRADEVLILYADMPLLTAETLRRVVDARRTARAVLSILTVVAEDPRGFGRVVRQADGSVARIVEEADATDEERALRELNAGVYACDAAWLWAHLPLLPLSRKGEYYLTDLVGMAAREGHPVVTVAADDPTEALGINTRVHLAEAEAVLRRRINDRWMVAGVTMIDPQTTYIEPTVAIGPDTVIWPNTILRGTTVVGRGCHLGPNTLIADSVIGDRCRVVASVVEGAVMEEGSDVGPFSHLRPGAHLGAGVHVGNFGEVKNARLGPGTRMGHFSYVGDAEVGAGTNIGAGTVTCNFDGRRKHRTIIGEEAFIGSGTMLVAPVRVGHRAVIGAGSVVTHDIPDDTVAYGVPARERRKVEQP